MKTHARVVIVGGGAMGVSLLYHLAKRGWSDIVLVEKHELTAGSTWHAAGLCTHFAHNATIMEMRAASVRLYRDTLPAETGLSTGFHACGALRITQCADRMDEFRHVQGIGRFAGYDFHLLSPAELKQVYPLCETDGLLGALYEPYDGHVDPTLATNAMATAARALGATIHRHNPVRRISRLPSNEWLVATREGDIRCEHVVNAAGTWCREIGTMMGLDLPVVPMLHQYVVTDTVAEISHRTAAGERELPIIRDPEQSWYLRQEREGYIIGPYEKAAASWAVDGVPADFGMELLPPDMDRIEPIIVQAMERVPALAQAGIKTVINGPITFTPDANPLIGPAFGLRNAWLLTGSSMGVMEGGGAGSFLADWMAEGAPPRDALAVDARRFGGYADRAYRIDKAVECFGLQFGIHYPFEERAAGRPRRVTPLRARQMASGAVFGCAFGWERPNWFSGDATGVAAPLTFGRPAWFEQVGQECRAVAASSGIADLSAFAKFDITGPGASAFLDCLGANRPPQQAGKIGLMHVLTPAGGIAAEFTVTRFGADRYYLTSAAAAERHDEDLLRSRAAPFAGVDIVNRTEQIGILAIMGPNARAVLAQLTDADLGDSAFPWLSAAMTVVAGLETRALRVSYVGELGWELHVPLAKLALLHSALTEAGRRFELRPFGAYAMNSMRLEKGYRAWGLDLTTERTPLECGLASLVRTQGRTFIGCDALIARAADSAGAWRMVLLEIGAIHGIDPFYSHVIQQDGRPVGIVTSGAYGHRIGKSLALAYLRPEVTQADFRVHILSHDFSANLLKEPPYDPANTKMSGRLRQARAP